MFGTYTPYWEEKQYNGVMYRFKFGNGYIASVVRHDHSYGGPAGLWEVAVLDSSEKLCYDTEITNDVLGRLNETQVAITLNQIESLPIRVGVES